AHTVGIDGPAAIHGIDEAVDFYGAILDAGFRDGGGVGIEGIERGNAASLALRQRLTPTSFFGRKCQNALEPRGVEGRLFFALKHCNLAIAADDLQAKRERILARSGGELVN